MDGSGQWANNKHSQKKHQQTKTLQTRENTKVCVLETVGSACLEWKESQLWMNRAEVFEDLHIDNENYTEDHWVLLCKMDNMRQKDHSISILLLLQVMEAARWERFH